MKSAKAAPKAGKKFLDRIYQGYVNHTRAMFGLVEKKKPAKFTVGWPDGPAWVRLYNLGWTAELASGEYVQSEDFEALGVDLDSDAIRACWKKFGKKEPQFFVQTVFPGNEEEEDLPKAAAKLRKSLDAKKGPFAEQTHGDPWWEWEALLKVLVDDGIMAARDDLNAMEPFKKKVEIDISGHDGGGPYGFYNSVNDLQQIRKEGAYQPSRALLEDFVGRMSSNTAYVKHWVDAFFKAKDPKGKVHPITGKARK